uniref:Uncharacterized protein n=1 Tax=Podoviridae sp. ct7Kl21 TaxID=2826541 RepID=A0A8S5MCW4_9CAUD|nr:MAG TPA: hypothetical protein [Podoviridae sp. ct7Kl21]
MDRGVRRLHGICRAEQKESPVRYLQMAELQISQRIRDLSLSLRSAGRV